MSKGLIVALVLVVLVISAFAFERTRPGTVELTSTPTGCQVLLDGNPTGQLTPCALSNIKPGKHSVLCQKEGYHEANGDVFVKPHSQQTMSLELNIVLTTGFISVSSSPSGAPVYLDGKATGKRTPFTLEKVKPGHHLVELKLPGYKKSGLDVEVAVEQTASVNSTLEKLPEAIFVVGMEDCNGKLIAVTPATGDKRILAPIENLDGCNVCAASPDGQLIALAEIGKLTILSPTGKRLRTINLSAMAEERDGSFRGLFAVGCSSIVDLSWHPSKRKVAAFFERYHEFCVYDCDRKSVTWLSKQAAVRGGAWSPDGTKTALLVGSEIVVGDAQFKNGGSITTSISTSAEGSYLIQPPLMWRPDGSGLMYFVTTKDFFKRDAKLITLDGKTETLSSDVYTACWSPDGRSIAVVVPVQEQGDHFEYVGMVDLLLLDSETSSERRILKHFHNSQLAAGAEISWTYLPEPSDNPGSLTVSSDPSGQKLLVDGNVTGKVTPATVEVKPGPHTVRVQYVDGSFSKEQRVHVDPGEKLSVKL